MNVRITENGGAQLDDIDEFAAMLIRELPGIAGSNDDRAQARIYQRPTGGKDDDLDDDWKENVEPELRDLFANAVDMVVDDLAAMKHDELEGLMLIIPPNHLDPWMHTLNLARLALGEIWDVTEDDMNSGHGSANGDPERTMAILKIDFYGMLMEFLIRLKWED